MLISESNQIESEWSGVEWSGVEWSGVEWSGVEWHQVRAGRLAAFDEHALFGVLRVLAPPPHQVRAGRLAADDITMDATGERRGMRVCAPEASNDQ